MSKRGDHSRLWAILDSFWTPAILMLVIIVYFAWQWRHPPVPPKPYLQQSGIERPTDEVNKGQLPVVRESASTTNGEAVDVDAQESCS